MRNEKLTVFTKTGCRCSQCGSYDNVEVGYFFPQWVRPVKDDIRNKIPICKVCKAKRGVELLELGFLAFLPIEYREDIMEFYKENRNYLKKYILSFGLYRTSNLLNMDYAKVVLESYDYYLKVK